MTQQHTASAAGKPAGPGGFTLIEIVIAMTILAILAAAAIPSIRSVQRERLAREPIQELLRIAKEARLQAMREQRPYQVVLHSGGFTATRYYDPYLNFADITGFVAAADQVADDPIIPDADSATNGAAVVGDKAQGTPAFDSPGNLPPTARAPKKKEWIEKYQLPPGITYNVKFWHETDPTEIQGETVKLLVFQSSGVCEPFHIHLSRENATFDVDFSALTVDIVKEASQVK